MNEPNMERFINAIASDLEEGGFREVTGTTLRRNLSTAVQAAMPMLNEQFNGLASQRLPQVPPHDGWLVLHGTDGSAHVAGYTEVTLRSYAVDALSAQPSTGGQGDAWAIKLARESAFAHSSEHAYLPQTREEANNWQPHEWVVAAIQTAAHGAPKPEGQEPITVEAVAEIFNHPEYGLSINWLLENGIGELQVGDVLMVSNRAITDEDGAGEVYAAPPAQQSAQVYLDGLDRALGEAIDQRDRYHEMADDLAEHIARITGVDIGEHSSANCPWQNAIEAAEEYAPVQAVDPADPWRGLYSPDKMPALDGVNLYHVAHPDLPSWPKDEDEERGIGPLVTAQGFALEAVFGEYPDDDGEEVDYCAWLASWTPDAPAGDGWRLVCIQDTEDGPAAFYVRPLALIDSQPVGEAIGEIVYSGEGGLQIEFYDGKPLAPMKLYAVPPAQAIVLDRYDAGLLSDVGGGDTAWWLDYLRAELGRAHDHYQHQVNPAKGAGHG